ncbi:MAG: radical SAM protein [bacterium]|nr:radical SAM protein [bacterium]
MANIMLTENCNLRCPYCFASEFTGKKARKREISLEQFRAILRFILLDGSERHLGLIGGEPTVHPLFGQFLQILQDDERVEALTVYTNGIALEKYIEPLLSSKMRLLINCNNPADIGETSFARLSRNVKTLAAGGAHLTLGINVYRQGFEASYLLPLLELFQAPHLRFSLSIPPHATDLKDPLQRFRALKSTMLALFAQLREHHIVPHFDCNFFPPCLFTAEEAAQFDGWGAQNPLLTLKSRATGCAPVIDIMPDGTAVRCFGLSESTKVNIRDFATISDLRHYYLRTVDAYALNCYYDTSCADCYKYKTAKCSAGCLVYKTKMIKALKEMTEHAASQGYKN